MAFEFSPTSSTSPDLLLFCTSQSKPEIIHPSYPKDAKEMALVTELIFSASMNDADAVERILKKSPHFADTGDYDRRCAIHVAAAEGKLDAVKMLLSHGASINVSDRWGETPLDGAAKNGQIEVATYLLNNGAQYGAEHITATLDPGRP